MPDNCDSEKRLFLPEEDTGVLVSLLRKTLRGEISYDDHETRAAAAVLIVMAAADDPGSGFTERELVRKFAFEPYDLKIGLIGASEVDTVRITVVFEDQTKFEAELTADLT